MQMDTVIIDVYGHLDSKCRQQLFSNCLTSGKPMLIIQRSDEHLYKRRGQLKAWGSGKEITYTMEHNWSKSQFGATEKVLSSHDLSLF